METVKAIIDWVAGNGRVIWDAPLVYGLTIFLVVAVSAKFFSWWYGRDIKSHETTISGLKTTHEAAIKLLDKQVEILTHESASQRRELEKVKPSTVSTALLPVVYGNSAVQSAAVEIKSGSVTFYGAPEQWSDSQISRFAAFTRLQESGAAKIELTVPTTSTVSAAVSVADLEKVLGNLSNSALRWTKPG